MKPALALASALVLCSCAIDPMVGEEEEQVADQVQDPRDQNDLVQNGWDTVPYGGANAYAFDDSHDYVWEDKSGTGTELRLADDGAEAFDLPFEFELYGETYSSVTVATNGVLAFAATDKFPARNANLPTVIEDASTFVAVHWDDLLTLGPSRIVYEVVGEEPNRRLFIQWHDVVHFSNPGADPGATFGVILEEHTNLMVFQYESLDLDSGLTTGLNNGESATVGLQSTGSFGQTYSFNTDSLSDERAILVYVDGCGADDECTVGCSYDPDCPVCIMDGDCNPECDSDPDCTVEECGMDGECYMACEDDPDCTVAVTCIADGMCDETCETDPDCENCESNDVCNPACPSDPECDGGCAAAASSSNRSAPFALMLMALMAVGILRRRR